ncbi:MAG: hypothetical protein LBT39_06660 [Treponema sp.]|jgi:hypothetical protein|nr:hypothetical protein [Treponema sp.]
MKISTALQDWEIKSCASVPVPFGGDLPSVVEKSGGEWIKAGDAIQVQMALIKNKVLSDSMLEDGDTRYADWVAEEDWVYRCSFEKPPAEQVFLHFKGIDTVADIFLNGKLIGQAQSMYLPYRFDISGGLQKQNTVLVYFHAHKKMIAYYDSIMPEAWRGNVPAVAMLRKSEDYASVYGYKPIGLFDDVLLECFDKTEIGQTDINVTFNLDHTLAEVFLTAEGPLYGDGSAEQVELEFCLTWEDGTHPVRLRVPVKKQDNAWKAEALLNVENPRLWWPRNYGDQSLYRVSYTLYSEGALCDAIVKITGLRDVQLIGSMRFEVNGVEVRWWGADIAPIYGATNRYNESAAMDTIEKAYQCNFNGVRIWGPGKPYPDSFYERFDRLGIMIWQDFPTGGSQLPDTGEYQALYCGEAEYMVKRLKAHPSIMLWCGGNEHIYMCEFHDNPSRIGFDTLLYGYRDVCAKYDPHRYYHVSCPYGGRYTNAPEYGDNHGSRAYRKYIPGEDYGVFFSENIRVYPPQYKSAVRFMKEDIWEDGFVDIRPFGCEYPMPSGWQKHLSNMSRDMGHLKFGPIEEYYSARNVDELIYKHTAAAANEMHKIVLRSRTGNPPGRSDDMRQCTGHMFWKYNDPWPHYYCSLYDYYGECNSTYYSVKRGYAPFLIHLESGDRIWLWGVNDTTGDKAGHVHLKIFDLKTNRVLKEKKMAAAVPAGRSILLGNLDDLCPFAWATVVFAEFVDYSGASLSKSYCFVTKENMIPFPSPELTLSHSDGILTLSTDAYARCITLGGNEDGDEFGWFFEDNYFDLLPFESKQVRILGRHTRGNVTAKAHYSDKIASIVI